MRLERSDPYDCCYVHLTLMPYISTAGELKTKPTQSSVRALRSAGIQPDVIVCRTEKPMTGEAKEKIALFCNVKNRQCDPEHGRRPAVQAALGAGKGGAGPRGAFRAAFGECRT